MARRFSAVQSHQPYFAAGLIAAHALGDCGKFRLRDAVFFINLLSNWMESFFSASVIGVTNVQTQRFLSDLTAEGWARRIPGKTRPHFALTRPGMLELVRSLTDSDRSFDFSNFLFSFFFLRSYGRRIRDLLRDSDGALPPAFLLELESLCDVAELVQRQRKRIEGRIQKVRSRISSTEAAREMCRGASAMTPTLLDQVEAQHPYQLNSERPLSALLQNLSSRDQLWELTEGGEARIDLLWNPTLDLLQHHILILNQLERTIVSGES